MAFDQALADLVATLDAPPKPERPPLEEAMAAMIDTVRQGCRAIGKPAVELSMTDVRIAIGQHPGLEPDDVRAIGYKVLALIEDGTQKGGHKLVHQAAVFYLADLERTRPAPRADRPAPNQPPSSGDVTVRTCAGCSRPFDRSTLECGRCPSCYERWEAAVFANDTKRRDAYYGPADPTSGRRDPKFRPTSPAERRDLA